MDGFDELLELVEEMPDKVNEILEDATKEAAEMVLADAKRRVKKDTWDLHDSLDVRLEKSKKETKKMWQVYSKGVSKGGVRYAFAVEGGTKKTKAQPFLRPALDENKDNVKRKISEVIVARLGDL